MGESIVARKGIMAGLMEDDEFTAVNSSNPESPKPIEAPARRGAFGMMSRAADEVAAKVEAAQKIEQQLLSGTQIIELDPDDLESSFVVDRIEDDDESSLQELIRAIRERGQDSPILVRPIPNMEGRYQVVFGHRRAKAAKALGIKVWASVKDLSDQEHVVAQGQENTARADLSFIERSLFAQKLAERFDNETVMSALAVNKTVLSKMQSVTTNIPSDLIYRIGAARGVGRDRWYDLSVLFKSDNALELDDIIAQDTFRVATSDERFAKVYDFLKNGPKTAKTKQTVAIVEPWAPMDESVRVLAKSRPKALTVEFSNPDGKAFGTWITNNLDALYEAFRKSKTEN
jgi:ParB family chromosome partitioning protein